ncbi:MAG: transcription elongation factor GreA [Clostridia bacterium]|nr:transcription elongation factor GreA [Clostridia bacterium]
MANEKKLTMTQEGYDELVKELNWREGEERERIKNDIVVARGFGDLSENAEYDAARNAQAENEARILQLRSDIENAEVMDASSLVKGIVNIGTVVKVVDEKSSRELTFRIVGSNEVDIAAGKISDISPVGRALIGHKAGDVVTDTVEASNYTFSYRIVEVTRD